MSFLIGILIGVKKVAPQECLRFQKKKTSTSKNTVAVSTRFEIRTTGVSQKVEARLREASSFIKKRNSNYLN